MKTLQTMSLVSIIAITLACGYSSKSTPAVAGTIPSITQLNPNAATAGGAAFVLTVNGTNFGTKAVVNWNGAAQTTTYVSSTQLTASVPASMIAASGTAQVTVTNPSSGGNGIYGGGTMAETSAAMDFTIN